MFTSVVLVTKTITKTPFSMVIWTFSLLTRSISKWIINGIQKQPSCKKEVQPSKVESY